LVNKEFKLIPFADSMAFQVPQVPMVWMDMMASQVLADPRVTVVSQAWTGKGFNYDFDHQKRLI